MIIIFFLLGLVFASFLNALAYRIDKEYPLVKMLVKSSSCEKCGKELDWYDLIPVLSFVFSKGACTKCGKKVTPYYPISELFLGIAIAALYYVQAPFYAHLAVMYLFFLTYFDITSKSIPKTPTDIFVIGSIVIRVILILLSGYSGILSLGGTLLALFVYSLWFLLARKKDVFGLGDVLVIAGILIMSDLDRAILFLLSTLFISGANAIILVMIDRKWLKKYVPFLPYILIGYVVSIVAPTSWLIDMFLFM